MSHSLDLIVHPRTILVSNYLFLFRSRTPSIRRRQISRPYQKLGKFSFFKEFTLLIVLGIVVPTVDVYSDGALIIQLSTSTHPRFAIALSVPLTISFLFLLPHWWKKEKTGCRRLMTFPLLLLQLWPQYRALQLLLTLWNNPRRFQTKLEEYNRDVSCLGKKFHIQYI